MSLDVGPGCKAPNQANGSLAHDSSRWKVRIWVPSTGQWLMVATFPIDQAHIRRSGVGPLLVYNVEAPSIWTVLRRPLDHFHKDFLDHFHKGCWAAPGRLLGDSWANLNHLLDHSTKRLMDNSAPIYMARSESERMHRIRLRQLWMYCVVANRSSANSW